ncbi:MAG TPA: lamin tail domain-containing protein [Gemmatimonadaceae bacterium]|nr:lamin tail domain-containing protein [Gemmatimonadaceae bacterium]
MLRLRRPVATIATLALALASCRPADSPFEPTPASPSLPAFALVPPEGTAADLDVAGWNIEWFGDTQNGPTNETLQLQNARDVILGTDADIWGVAEIVNQAQWNSLESQLPGYTGFLASESVVANGASYYSATEQKVGILFKTSVATLLDAKVILTANNTDFAGRPPLEVKLRVSVNGATEDVVVIVLHMKAFNDGDSWLRRQNAGNALKSYLDATYPTQKVLVIGDWNDDVDVSITPEKPSPYKAFVDDAARYRYPTKALTDRGVSSTVGYPDFIDHHLATNEIAATEIASSVEVYRVDSYIADYANTTSDHYPVLSHYAFGTGGGSPPPPPPPPPPPSGAPAKVIVNEIMANEPGSSTAGEYVEVVNVGGTAIAIGGWTISDGTAVRHTFAAGTTLNPGQGIVVFAGASGIPAGTPNAIASSTGSLNLANAGDQVILKNGTTVIDSFSYGSSLAGSDGVSMNRNPDLTAGAAFALHTTISTLKASPGTRASGAAF